MIHLCYSNRIEPLFEAFAASLEVERRQLGSAGLFAPIQVVVPNRLVGAWLLHRLAERDGIAAHIEFHQLHRFFGRLIGERLATVERTQDRLLTRFLEPGGLDDPALRPVRAWIEAGSHSRDSLERRKIELAKSLSTLFEEYAFSRPAMLQRWPRGTMLEGSWSEIERWQRRLWLDLFKEPPAPAAPIPWSTAATLPLRWEGPVHFFGLSYVAVTFHQLFERCAQTSELRLYTLNPCMEYWEDLREGEDSGPLALWGKPGRENIHQLNELTRSEHQALFVNPAREHATLLTSLQRRVLLRGAPEMELSEERDDSIRILQAPGVRREAEAIAREIDALLREDHTLRFHEIGIAIASRDPEPYLAHVATALSETNDLPHVFASRLPAKVGSLASAAAMLLDLPLGHLGRSELVRFLSHEALASRLPGASPESIAALVAELGIFSGADRDARAGSYVEADRFNWDQGLRRLALGAVMASPSSEDDALPFSLENERYYPVEGEEWAGLFGALCRSLLSDLQLMREGEWTTREWARHLNRFIRSYLEAPPGALAGRPKDARERELKALSETIWTLTEFPLDDRKVSYRVVHDLLAPALDTLAESRLELGRGIALGTLPTLSLLPFRVLFIAGLNEKEFPASDPRNPLDLRAAASRPGDVSPRERDHYRFLEALLSTREKLRLSYVGRDEHTGEPLSPSSVVGELTRMLGSTVEEVRIPLWPETAPLPKLAFPAAPSSVPQGSNGPLRIELRALREFLESPLQASTRFHFGLYESEGELALDDDEPFAFSPLQVPTLLRKSLLASLSSKGIPPLEAYASLAERAEARGEIPSGLLGASTRAQHQELLESWTRKLPAIFEEAPRVFERLPIAWNGNTYLLSGTTEPLIRERSASLLFESRSPPQEMPLDVLLWKRGLAAFLDRVALSALGLAPEREHQAWIFLKNQKIASLTFEPIGRTEAVDWLDSLAAELVAAPRPIFLPCEAVLLHHHQGIDVTEALERLRAKDARLTSSRDPIRFADRTAPLSEAEARARVSRRFGLFLSKLRRSES